MNKNFRYDKLQNFLKLPSEHFWILTKREKSQLLTELKRRVEVLS